MSACLPFIHSRFFFFQLGVVTYILYVCLLSSPFIHQLPHPFRSVYAAIRPSTPCRDCPSRRACAPGSVSYPKCSVFFSPFPPSYQYFVLSRQHYFLVFVFFFITRNKMPSNESQIPPFIVVGQLFFFCYFFTLPFPYQLPACLLSRMRTGTALHHPVSLFTLQTRTHMFAILSNDSQTHDLPDVEDGAIGANQHPTGQLA